MSTRQQQEYKIPLMLDCVPVSRRKYFYLTQGIPFAEGILRQGQPVTIVDDQGRRYPTQYQTMATWKSDLQHVKWLLIDAQLPACISDSGSLYLDYKPNIKQVLPEGPININRYDERFPELQVIYNDCLRLEFSENSANSITALSIKKDGKWRNVLGQGKSPVLYMQDQHKHSFDSVSAAPTSTIDIEEEGPVRSSVCIRGMHADDEGHLFCPYILRIHMYAGSTALRIFHTFIFDQNPDQIKLSSIGMRFNFDLGAKISMIAGEDGQTHHVKDQQYLGWLQKDDTHYEITTDSKCISSGEKSRNWFSLAGDSGHATVFLRDGWQEYPKGVILKKDGLMDIQLWPANADKLLDLEVPWKKEFINCSAENIRTEQELLAAMKENPEKGVNFKGFYGSVKMPKGAVEGNMQSVKEAKEFAEKYCKEKRFVIGDVSCSGKATGLSKTHEIWLNLCSTVQSDTSNNELTAMIQAPAIAPPLPEYTFATGIAGVMHPENQSKFPLVENAIELMFDNIFDTPVAEQRLYGMVNYGDLLNCHGRTHGYTYRIFKEDPKYKITDLIGWFNNECFDNCYTQWLLFLRSGKRKYWRLAEAYAEHIEDVDTVHASPLHLNEVGLTHYHNIMHWNAGCSRSHTQIHGWLIHYFLTGNKRALEVAREAADNFVSYQESAGMVSNRYSKLRREFTGPMGTLWLFYEATWEEKYGDCAKRSLDILLKSHTLSGMLEEDIFTGGKRGDEFINSKEKSEPRGWFQEADVLFNIYRLTKDNRIKESVLKIADAIIEAYHDFKPDNLAELLGDTYMIYEKVPPMWLAFAFQLTKKKEYLEPLKELLVEFPEMAKAWAMFDKWTPIQIAGYMPRFMATAMQAVIDGEKANE
jgi:exo-rhamnogalacturonan lyase-like protein